MRRIIACLFLFFFFTSVPCWAYWIWTPKGGWSNPKTDLKKTPQTQFAYAKEFYDGKNYEDAKKEFNRLLKKFPKAAEAAEAQYYLGLIEDAQGNLYQGFLAYQKVIDKYPFSERIAQIIKLQFDIGEKFMDGHKRKSMGIDMPVENPAIEIFNKVVENSSFGSFAPKAQYKLGLVYKSLSRYYEAEDAFNRVVTAYPDSEWVEPAKFQIAECRASVSRNPNYDQVATEEAKKKFEEFVQEHPDAVLAPDAEKNINELKLREAESNYNIGLFYEKQKALKSAKTYYQDVVDNVPDSIWAAKAAQRIAVIEKKPQK
jgi:outer membrane assembly lipoprotein YfiO